MDPNENQADAAMEVVMLGIQGIVEDQLPEEPVNEVLRGLLPEQGVGDEAANNLAVEMKRAAKVLENDRRLNQAIDAAFPVNRDTFGNVMKNVIEDSITWGKIFVLAYAAARFIVKMIKARLRQSLKDTLVWTCDFFQSRILSWIVQQGGWVSYLSSCSTLAVQY